MIREIERLVDSISQNSKVSSIAVSGEVPDSLEKVEGDIDVFVYCSDIPGLSEREAILSGFDGIRVSKEPTPNWGFCDFLLLGGVETWVMYFSQKETSAEIDSILAGEFITKQNNYFYPTGRCAMLKNFSVLIDRRGFLKDLIASIQAYPEILQSKLVQHHFTGLEDFEDLERATKKCDVLFFHFALDLAIDSFLQLLFALNGEFFPGRKRTLQFLCRFSLKPWRCGERLLEIIELSGSGRSLGQALKAWKNLASDLLFLVSEPDG